MQSPFMPTGNAPIEIDPRSLRDVPVSQGYREVFAALIQEQAARHQFKMSAAETTTFADRLYAAAIERGGINAFLVVAGQQVVGAVTYSKSLSANGVAVHMEDIITTAAARKQGVGHFSMRTLAEHSLKLGAQSIDWDCLATNTEAHAFYTGLNAERLGCYSSWRYPGALNTANIVSGNRFVVRPMETADIGRAASILQWVKRDAGMYNWLGKVARESDKDFFFLVAQERAAGTDADKVVGVAYGHRSFSTFRALSGLHVGGLAASGDVDGVNRALLVGIAAEQERRGCNGHVDITLDHRPETEAFLAQRGFEPLSYAAARTVGYQIDRNQMRAMVADMPRRPPEKEPAKQLRAIHLTPEGAI